MTLMMRCVTGLAADMGSHVTHEAHTIAVSENKEDIQTQTADNSAEH